MLKNLLSIFLPFFTVFFLGFSICSASSKGTIIFIPHDDRPTSGEVSAEAVERDGYNVLMPDKKLLGGLYKEGQPEELWQWTKENAPKANAIIVSTDSLIYGGLVNSRKHELPASKLNERLQHLQELKKLNRNLKIYAFTSLMRTPKNGLYSGNEEPAYYLTYGADFFNATALMDKAQTTPLTSAEEKALATTRKKIPQNIWKDWINRRQKNFSITKKLIDLNRKGTLDYLIIGKDDNAPLSATHDEATKLTSYSTGLTDDKFQITSGIDEFAMLLLSRVVNSEKNKPFIYVDYNIGTGKNTVPAFSDETIDQSINNEIAIAGACRTDTALLANLVLLVNTEPSGKTGDGDSEPTMPTTSTPRPGTIPFADKVTSYLNKGYKVAIADIAFANGSDNALMSELNKRKLLFKLTAYAGWNTPTNSSGFVIGQGLVATSLSDADCDTLLLKRYLDDWGYQSNVREKLMDQIYGFRQPDLILNFGDKETGICERATLLMRDFAKNSLPPFAGLNDLTMSFPWHSTFIGQVNLPAIYNQ